MTRDELLAFLRRHHLAVVSTVGPTGAPQSAVVGVVVSDALELFFDTLDSTRKLQNLRRDPRLSAVIGWDEEQTVQYEGLAEEVRGPDLDRLLPLYFARFPDGRARKAWPGLVYVRARPTWIRYSDFRGSEPRVEEMLP